MFRGTKLRDVEPDKSVPRALTTRLPHLDAALPTLPLKFSHNGGRTTSFLRILGLL